MKKGIVKFLIMIFIVFGVLYLSKSDILLIKDIISNENKIDLNEGDKAVSGNSSNISDTLILVNKDNGLDKNYVPKKISIPNIPFTDIVNNEEKNVSETIINPLERLFNTAEYEGITLYGNSGYRSYNSQKKVFKERVISQGTEMAEAYVAKPGFSEHQTGLCIDITNKDNYLAQGTKEAVWLEENAHKFGFIIRYPLGKEDITGIQYEPWHIRYVGEEAAEYIYEHNITLEEYLGK